MQTSLTAAPSLLQGKSSSSAGSSDYTVRTSAETIRFHSTRTLCLLSFLQGLRFNKVGKFYYICIFFLLQVCDRTECSENQYSYSTVIFVLRHQHFYPLSNLLCMISEKRQLVLTLL